MQLPGSCGRPAPAVNLSWAIERQLARIATGATATEKTVLARETAEAIANEDAEQCRQIGVHGLELIQQIASRKNGEPVNVLTRTATLAGWPLSTMAPPPLRFTQHTIGRYRCMCGWMRCAPETRARS